MKQFVWLKNVRGVIPGWELPKNASQKPLFCAAIGAMLREVASNVNALDAEQLPWVDISGSHGEFYPAGATAGDFSEITSPLPGIKTVIPTWTGMKTMGFHIRITDAFQVLYTGGASIQICDEIERWVRYYIQEWIRSDALDEWRDSDVPSASVAQVLIEYQPDELEVVYAPM